MREGGFGLYDSVGECGKGLKRRRRGLRLRRHLQQVEWKEEGDVTSDKNQRVGCWRLRYGAVEEVEVVWYGFGG